MEFGFVLSAVLLLCSWPTAKCDPTPDGVQLECRDRYFRIAVDLPTAGTEVRFEAVDETGVYPITQQYGAVCGYTVSVLPLQGLVELRASYFSCHTNDQLDEDFTFNFNLITNNDGEETTYALTDTCSLALPWSPRELSCELNYMEVSMRSDVACPTGTRRDDWTTAVQTAYTSATSDWQVMFQRVEEEQPVPMNLSDARKRGYMFDLTEGRLVFRSPYGQPDSFSTEVNGVPVEVVHATLFSRQSWVVLMVDLVAACSMHEGSYDENGYMLWETPELLQPLVSGLYHTQVNVGADGELVERQVAEERGYTVDKFNGTLEISVPYNAEGGYRKSVVDGGLHEFYIFNLYLEQVLVAEDHVDTRTRFHRMLGTPLLPLSVFSENRTVGEDKVFTVYLGDVPEDVVLSALQLNQHPSSPDESGSGHSVTKVLHPNNTQGFTVTAAFDDSVVLSKFSKEAGAMMHFLEVNFSLTVDSNSFSHLISVMSQTEVSPPEFESVCSESGITFKLAHRPSDYLWEVCIASDLLTPELATERGYFLTNNSQSLQLEVPLFTHGYEYKDVGLKGFQGTFELLVRDRETSEVQSSAVQTCPFTTAEFIMCSTDGRMTVMADLTQAVAQGGVPARTNLMDKYCGPKEAGDTRALFSFPLNSCGSIIKLGKEHVTYENEISFSKKFSGKSDSGTEIERVKVQCQYPLSGLHRLFSIYKFESDSVGAGQITRVEQSTEVVQAPVEFNAVFQTPVPAMRRTRPVLMKPSYQLPAQRVRFPTYSMNIGRGAEGSSQVKVYPGQ